MSTRLRGPLLAVLFLCLSPAVAPAASLLVPDSSAMAVGAAMPMPSGHREFCLAHPQECGPVVAADPIEMTPARWRTIWKVNRAVNATIRGRTDMEIFGREEVWTYPDTEGDCEDFALLKRRQLIEAGFPEADLLMTTVRLEDGSGHAVLTLRTSDGDYVLDNLENRVLPWRETAYDYVRRQSSANAGLWLSIENGGGTRLALESVSKSN
jgi:Predicted periplasmic protein